MFKAYVVTLASLIALTVNAALIPARSTVERRASYIYCNETQQQELAAAATAAHDLAASAVQYLKAHPSTTPRYNESFGEYSPERHTFVLSMYEYISNYTDFSGAMTYECDYCPDTVAWVQYDVKNVIHVCGSFFGVPSNWQGGTLIHEASHFLGAWDDTTGNPFMWANYPDGAIHIATLYGWFAINPNNLE
ncbi:hypothetical protein D9756_002506 [Leucocoprinus leucothites]|uniref:Lysine-specific metallo-endopeptidase domain-containing protein n=1 Tax=Leucocoprinus leucothites TaxID=201217 RepID=A0A8H5LM54_9AGAR|nr:hypothetical protein D9756_002506 [Leucoagaricus leucothites]